VARSRQGTGAELDRLELTVRRLLESHDAWRQRAEAAQARVAELERTVRDLSTGSLDPVAMAGDVRSLEAENRELKDRLVKARAGVQRMQARLQFVEEER
jgi:chromosome segregation ATPase